MEILKPLLVIPLVKVVGKISTSYVILNNYGKISDTFLTLSNFHTVEFVKISGVEKIF